MTLLCSGVKARHGWTPNRSPGWLELSHTTSFAALARGSIESTYKALRWKWYETCFGKAIWYLECVCPVIKWGADEPALTQTSTQGLAKTDPDARSGADGHRPSAQSFGVEGDDHAGDRQKSRPRRIHRRTRRRDHSRRIAAAARART